MSTGGRYGDPQGKPPTGQPSWLDDESGDPGWEDAPQPTSRSSSNRPPTTPTPSSPSTSGYPELGRYFDEDAPRPARHSSSGSSRPASYGAPPAPARTRSSAPYETDWDLPPDEAELYDENRAGGSSRVPPSARSGARQRSSRSTSSVSVTVPEVGDRIAVGALLASLLGLVFMLVITASKVGGLPDWNPLKLDASGDVALWGSPGAMWRIPFGVLMMFVMSAVVAFLLAKKDQFTARVVAIATVMVQLIAWIALVDHLW